MLFVAHKHASHTHTHTPRKAVFIYYLPSHIGSGLCRVLCLQSAGPDPALLQYPSHLLRVALLQFQFLPLKVCDGCTQLLVEFGLQRLSDLLGGLAGLGEVVVPLLTELVTLLLQLGSCVCVCVCVCILESTTYATY